VLIAMSDNGPQMRSHATREFMAACAIMQRFCRPGTPTDQAWIESLFGHIKTEWPHLEKIRDPHELVLELDRVRQQYNTVRLHAGIGYVTPDDEHLGRATRSAKPAATGCSPHAKPGSPTVDPSARTTHDRAPILVGYFSRPMPERVGHTSATEPPVSVPQSLKATPEPVAELGDGPLRAALDVDSPAYPARRARARRHLARLRMSAPPPPGL
jgi:hypothetical protein